MKQLIARLKRETHEVIEVVDKRTMRFGRMI